MTMTTVTAFADSVGHLVCAWTHFNRSIPMGKRAASQQGGLLSGGDPTEFNPADPIRIWIIQVGLILVTTQLLSLLLRKIRQPRVIAEVLGGILLGPTAFGRIPGFTEHIFNPSTIPFLNLSANIGLVLFLFLVGLEIDGSVIKQNARLSATIALGGMLIPFGIGVGYSVALYRQFVDPATHFTHFMLFVGVSFSITAFPVLCRILTELKLLDTNVGLVVLSAGVANDIVGWTLLALSIALVNASSGLTALWILLTAVGWTLFLLFPVKRGVRWLAHKTGSIENGPTMFFMTVTVLMVFGSAFFTDVIGVHAIFGGFLMGLVIPRDGGLAIALTEKLEDMVSIIFLPLYFTLSGLSTDLGLLNNGITWAYAIGIISLAYVGKFGGGTIAARLTGFSWREATTIGTLMSCKGLVELIVLNVGLSAGILDRRVFSMFVLEALSLTFMTTPVVVKLYPPHLRKRIHANNSPAAPGGYNGGSKVHGSLAEKKPSLVPSSHDENPLWNQELAGSWKEKIMVVLDKVEHLPSTMSVMQLFRPGFGRPDSLEIDGGGLSMTESNGESGSSNITPTFHAPPSSQQSHRSFPPHPSLSALRLITLSDRTSAVMKSSLSPSLLLQSDPLINVLRTFSEVHPHPLPLENVRVSVEPFERVGYAVRESVAETESDIVLVSWLPAQPGADSPLSASVPPTPGQPSAPGGIMPNPFDLLFNFSGGGNPGGSGAAVSSTPRDAPNNNSTASGLSPQPTHVPYPANNFHFSSTSIIHSQFIRAIFAQSNTDVALFVDRGVPTVDGTATRQIFSKTHIFLPFFGGPDDRLALRLVVQFCARVGVGAKVVRMLKSSDFQQRTQQDSVQTLQPAHLAEVEDQTAVDPLDDTGLTMPSWGIFPDTLYNTTTQTRLQSETADNILWQTCVNAKANGASTTGIQSLSLAVRLARDVTFDEHASPTPLHDVVTLSQSESLQAVQSDKRPFVFLGRGRRLAKESHHAEMKTLMAKEKANHVAGEIKKTMGDTATACMLGGVRTGLLVVQAAVGNEETGW